MIKTIQAKHLRPGDWILYKDLSTSEHVVAVQDTRNHGEIKVYHDYGNGGEPATSFWDGEQLLKIQR